MVAGNFLSSGLTLYGSVVLRVLKKLKSVDPKQNGGHYFICYVKGTQHQYLINLFIHNTYRKSVCVISKIPSSPLFDILLVDIDLLAAIFGGKRISMFSL